ncbi:hypothetical protein LCGC14_1712130 [marine sediment metagenome]|uniref:Uncharacterized protein n=1 Tax=marine sediment metagenome TaxID=412755 RepID=A0A0F9HFD4_9ZZZZ
MYNWLYFIYSDKEYHSLMNFLLGEETVSGITYLIFSEDIVCRGGKVFHKINGFVIAVSFYTNTTFFKDNLVKDELKLSSLIDMYEIVSKSGKSLAVTERAKYIVFDEELKVFLKKHNFAFNDGSILTIPGFSSSRRL